jgi:hypothetical protein
MPCYEQGHQVVPQLLGGDVVAGSYEEVEDGGVRLGKKLFHKLLVLLLDL